MRIVVYEGREQKYQRVFGESDSFLPDPFGGDGLFFDKIGHEDF